MNLVPLEGKKKVSKFDISHLVVVKYKCPYYPIMIIVATRESEHSAFKATNRDSDTKRRSKRPTQRNLHWTRNTHLI